MKSHVDNASIFFTSDLHIGHNKEFIWKSRGFSSIQAHDVALVKNWNEKISEENVCFVLGDLTLGCDIEYAVDILNQLHGTIFWIRGNHDSVAKIEEILKRCPNIHSIIDISYEDPKRKQEYVPVSEILRAGKTNIYLSHYPTILETENFCLGQYGRYRSICLHGHTHSKDKYQFGEFCCYNVALDAHEMSPVSLKKIFDDLNKRKQMWEKEQETHAN